MNSARSQSGEVHESPQGDSEARNKSARRSDDELLLEHLLPALVRLLDDHLGVVLLLGRAVEGEARGASNYEPRQRGGGAPARG